MTTVCFINTADLSGFREIKENDFPSYLYHHLYQTLRKLPVKEKEKVKLMFNDEDCRFALICGNICIMDEEEEEEEFMDDLIAD